ncbi:suppressor APC domain-containing protein 2 [Denticeps clupeoides]|uniref:Suppressor APC domain-containing protein n=1 Tax=Denticeps clupeoides TaxID=299321 RepID=A0AAY4CDH1_9TELE|nr:suppressor APC domain-containing protein 2 [Denticeps clupeoides]
MALNCKSRSPAHGGMQAGEADLTTEGLPKAFLHSLRTLFDILDDGRRGYVHVSEIESHWRGAETRGLPGGVLDSLRRVTPPHGCLTFERFVAGLRYSMLNPQAPAHQPGSRGCEGKVRPLGPSNVANIHHNRARLHDAKHAESSAHHPACAPRHGPHGYARTGRSLERIPVAYRTDAVRVGKKGQPQHQRSVESLGLESPQLHKQSAVETAGLPRSQSETTTGFSGSRRHGRSRDEHRRHTITNGVDYGVLKQMKELEQEKDSLLAGLDVVERAREWYQTQIHNVSERQRQVGQSNCTDFSSESSESRLNVLLPKLQEVNHCLNDLISCAGMPFPSPGTQASTVSTGSQSSVPAPSQAIQRLKDQNRLLTQEVTDRSERITQLEQEKSALIKQLFDARARSAHDSSALDSTFI